MSRVIRIHLHIDRLILDGIDLNLSERLALQTALEAELGRLFTENDFGAGLQYNRAVPSLSAESIPLSSEGVALGTHLARTVYREVGNESVQHSQ